MNSVPFFVDYDKPLYTIGVVADLLNVSVQTLRLYEREDLIIPFKKESNHRLYSQRDMDRLQCIRKAITEKKFSIQAIKTMFSLIPCWQLKSCSHDDRKNCPAFTSHSGPCWSVRHSGNICELQNCRDCHVYRDYSNCEEIKNGIINSTSN